MKCPKCESNKTERVHVTDPQWLPGGAERCLYCYHVGEWSTFADAPKIKMNICCANHVVEGLEHDLDALNPVPKEQFAARREILFNIIKPIVDEIKSLQKRMETIPTN